MSEVTDAPRIALVEDERNLRELYSDLLSARGLQVVSFGTIGEAEPWLGRAEPDALILDIKLPDGDGLVLLQRLRSRGFRAPVLVTTAFGTVDRAVQALRAGASDFLVKPFTNERLVTALEAALESGRRLTEVELRAGSVESDASSLIGASGGLRDVVSLLPRVASSEATVLLRGESGTGKELVAHAIHAASPRLDGPFVAVNCAALPPSLLESELFGFERGAFTGAHARRKGFVESADGGTLFLDEIGDMPLEAQARLLRMLQEREIVRVGGREPVKVDVRVIAATHRPLEAMVKAGTFRGDLLYRLAVIPIRLPPLRDRRQDIPGLVAHFIAKHAARHRLPAMHPTPAELASLVQREWPGNVRELENFVERAVVLGRFELEPAPVRTAPAEAPPSEVVPLRTAVAEAERRAVVAALRAAHGNKTEAARLLGVSYKTLFNKINEHEIREALSIE
jgi:DNA-binding NtrC family response regulator